MTWVEVVAGAATWADVSSVVVWVTVDRSGVAQPEKVARAMTPRLRISGIFTGDKEA